MSNLKSKSDSEGTLGSTLTRLNILPVNKTVVFYSPLEGKDVLVRTGTIGDGSCLVHSILQACSNEYVIMNLEERRDYVKKIRSSLAEKISKNSWEKLSDGIIAKIAFQEKVNYLFSKFLKYISDSNHISSSIKKIIKNIIVEKDDLEAYKLLFELVSLEDMEKKVLPESYKNCEDKILSESISIILKSSKKYYKKLFEGIDELDKSQKQFFINKFETVIKEVLEQASEICYNEYIHNLKTSSVDIDTFSIDLISDYFDIDIYFIDSKTRMPYMNSSKNNIKKRTSVIVMWVNECHYEIIGKLLSGNRIQRQFEFDDSIIQCLYTFLMEQDNIQNKYPHLIPYLPKNVRKDINASSKNNYNVSSLSRESCSTKSP